MRGISAVLFDFGGIFTGSPFIAVKGMTVEPGTKPGRLMQLVFGACTEDNDHPWHRVERGEISLENTRKATLELDRAAGLEVDIYQMLPEWVHSLMAACGGYLSSEHKILNGMVSQQPPVSART